MLQPAEEMFQKLLNGEIADANIDPATQKMMREFNAEEKECYKCLRKKEPEEFRLAWARTHLKSLVEIKGHIKEYQKIDTSLGEYTSASRIIWTEGGTQ